MAQIYIATEEIENYIQTLEICKNNLPGDATKVHESRLRELIEKLERVIENNG